ncbi:MAG: hypothetical protein K2L64_01880 [Ureaplasma sp.]|nr:hypothetical protein [Ureaplasma sp.]
MINLIQEVHGDYEVSLQYGDEIWVKEIHPKIVKINNKYNSFFSNEQIEKCNQFNNNIKSKQKELKKLKTNFAYWMFLIFGLFFSILLIIPAYFSFKYLSNVKKKISSLEKTISSLIKEKLDFLFNSVCCLELNNYFKEINSLTRYEDRGPLNKTISNLIKENSSFKLENNSKRNTFCSSWGVFGGDKIVVNLSTAKLKFEKPITIENSSTTKYYVYSSSNINGKEEIYENEWIETTTYQRPIFEYSNSNWFYMKTCENLELRLDKVSNSKDKSLWFDKDSDLENQKFNDLFNWKYNDKVQYRMIFTPYTQEFYVNNSFDKDDNFRMNYNLRKKNSFITNTVDAIKLS